MMNTTQLYPSRAHLLTQDPVWVEFALPDIPDIDDWYAYFTDRSKSVSIRVDNMYSNNARMYAKLSVPNISANSVPYTTNITPDTPIFYITKD